MSDSDIDVDELLREVEDHHEAFVVNPNIQHLRECYVSEHVRNYEAREPSTLPLATNCLSTQLHSNHGPSPPLPRCTSPQLCPEILPYPTELLDMLITLAKNQVRMNH